ncbi:MAG: acetyl-CoA hydrolase/transferase family protein [Acidimicrobiia bacterium]|nr:acetyl-CoA hydrolase/transferase family protein [Acidimicrobiia bacterium]
MYAEMEEAVALLRPSDVLVIPLGPGQPGGFLHALAERDDWVDLRIYGALLVDLYEIIGRPGVRFVSAFFGPAERFLIDSGVDIDFLPTDFRRAAPIAESQAPRVMATMATLPDDEGWMSLSLHAGATVDELRRCAADPDRVLVVEASAAFPRTHGMDPLYHHSLHISEADVVVRSETTPVLLEDPEPTDADRVIADHVAGFITDGTTLQTGIGGIPSLVARLLAEGDGGDYGIHSEMFTTGLMALHEAGKVTNRKGIFDGVSVTTFSAGTAALYEWLDDNHDVAFLPVHLVNSPEVIARNRRFVSINGALAIDLAGQVVADTIGGRQFSGIGGHEDFLAGAALELEDRSLLCLPSAAEADGAVVSRIVPRLDAGSIVTTPRHQVDVVITEYGVAELQGLTVRERAAALAAISHPSVRSDLEAVAEQWRAR